MCVYVSTHAHTYTYIHKYIHTYVHTYVHTYMQTYIPTCIHICIRVSLYIHTYTYTPEALNPKPYNPNPKQLCRMGPCASGLDNSLAGRGNSGADTRQDSASFWQGAPGQFFLKWAPGVFQKHQNFLRIEGENLRIGEKIYVVPCHSVAILFVGPPATAKNFTKEFPRKSRGAQKGKTAAPKKEHPGEKIYVFVPLLDHLEPCLDHFWPVSDHDWTLCDTL